MGFNQLHFLRYLQEIGYTDKVLEMRSARVRSLLGITTEDLPDNDNIHSVRENQRKSKASSRQNVIGEGNNDSSKLPSRYANQTQLL